jgi:hypothetical protein
LSQKKYFVNQFGTKHASNGTEAFFRIEETMLPMAIKLATIYFRRRIICFKGNNICFDITEICVHCTHVLFPTEQLCPVILLEKRSFVSTKDKNNCLT